ncbi:MAG TPA: site-specific integrase, partial [Thermoguttaceae bacterium]|nr:site-specific integrase [Thermoguttaceae bacterium]
MPRLVHSTPKYRKHRASGQAVVTIQGKDFYLGPWKSKASLVEYDRLIAEWLANGRHAPVPAEDRRDLTVTEVVARYWRFAKQHYQKDGKPTSSLDEVRLSLKPVREVYGHTLARDFGPLALKAVRQRMVDAGQSRGTVNKRIATVKRAFKWAVSEELVPPSVHHALSAVAGLQKGRTTAPESNGVPPVPEEVVQATLPHLPEIVADMVWFQRLTGARPGEVCIVRPCDIDRTGDVWVFRPESHKMEHHGRERLIFIGPKGQAILRPYLLRSAEAYCFSPAESVKKHLAEKHASRKTPLQYGNRPGTNRKRRPKRKAGDCYTRDSYRRAIHRACTEAEVEQWSPNRLRHSAGTEIRKRFGLEAAQVTLG